MVISRFESDLRKKKAGFAGWRMLTWVMLIVAGFLGAQYITHLQKLWSALQTLPAGDSENAAALHGMLSWMIGYLVASFVVIVACAGCILRQAWARPVLRIVALVLSVWLAYCAALVWHQMSTLDQLAASFQAPMGDLKRPLLIALALQAAAIPLLLWLAWQLGQPAVRLQFRPRVG